MPRPPFTSADLAVFRHARAAAPQRPRAPQPQPSAGPAPLFWGLLAQKLGVLLAPRSIRLASRKSPSRA
jgi:hypothetical protein